KIEINNKMRKIPVAIINYNGKKTLAQTIESLYKSTEIEVDIYVYDDCSTDNALQEISQKFPEVKIYSHPKNVRNPNVFRNLALKQINSERIFITDNDILYDENCLKHLSEAMDLDSNIAACSPRLMYLGDENRTYFAGVKIHFIGAAIGNYRDEIVDHSDKEPEPNSGSGILLVNKNKALEVGLFDEDYGLAWGDDGEFFQRLLLRGYKCLYIPKAFGYHEYKPFSNERSYRAVGQVTNRLMFITTHYSKRTVLLLIPAFIVYELMEFVFMLAKKMPHLFLKGEIAFWNKRELVRKKRKFIRSIRVVSDKAVLYSGEIYISPGLINGNKTMKVLVSVLQKFFQKYWEIIYPLIP
ncbi:MAG: glycosyltransferase, partial [Ignavibacteriae bacterium]|nr:glycosyltransferase [Ignavibacteriota bacterium]